MSNGKREARLMLWDATAGWYTWSMVYDVDARCRVRVEPNRAWPTATEAEFAGRAEAELLNLEIVEDETETERG